MKKYLTLLTLAFFLGMSHQSAAQISFAKHEIAAVTNPYDVFAVDLDQDNDMDFLTVGAGNGGEVRWWKNGGNMNFSSSLIASGMGNPRSVRAGDIDLDGDTDIIAALYAADQISWWENDGNQVFQQHIIANQFDGAHTVELCDLDQDGDIDVLCCEFDNSEASSEVAWWENDGQQNWTKHVVSSRFQQATFVYGADMDNDGDNDLIACGELNGEVVWWENNGQQEWTEFIIDDSFSMAHTILPRDFDKDGDLDILAHACMSSRQAWYENRGSGEFIKHDMENLGGAIWLEMGDFDLDGDQDLVGTGMTAPNLICYENNGRMELSGEWINGAIASGFALNVGDLDGDYDLDIVAIGFNSNSLAWWENTTDPALALNGPKWLCEDPLSDEIFVSNEAAGSIGSLSQDGFSCLIRNDFPVSTSMVADKGQLWINVAAEIIGIDQQTGCKVGRFRLPVQFLSGLTQDSNGKLYASDPFSGIVLSIDRENGLVSTLTSGLVYPQFLYFDQALNKLILLDGENELIIKIINPEDGSISAEISTDLVPGGAIIGDGQGNYYITAPAQNSIYSFSNNFATGPFAYRTDLNEPVGMLYHADDQVLVVANSGDNSLVEIPATATAVSDYPQNEIRFILYPNPSFDEAFVLVTGNLLASSELSVYTSQGRLVWTSKINRTDGPILIHKGYQKLAPGKYHVVLSSGNQSFSKTLVKLK